MGLRDLLTGIADNRRAKQLETLRVRERQLQAEFADAIAQGDDAAADKVHAQRERLAAEIRAAEVALAEQQRQAKAKAAQEAEQALERRHAERDAALAKLADEAMRFDELLGEVSAQWAAVAAAAEHAHRCCVAVGGDLDRELTPLAIWRRCWVRFGQRVPYEVPAGAHASKTIAPVAETLAKYRTVEA